MRAGEAFRDAFRLLSQALQDFPNEVNRWLRSRHHPFDVLGDGSAAICYLCKVDWPCDEFVRLDALIEDGDRP